MNTEFECEYGLQQDFKPSPMRELAAEYHRRCEQYDRTVCSGPIGTEGIMPMDHRELYMVNMNAHKVLSDLEARAEVLGYQKHHLRQAIARF